MCVYIGLGKATCTVSLSLSDYTVLCLVNSYLSYLIYILPTYLLLLCTCSPSHCCNHTIYIQCYCTCALYDLTRCSRLCPHSKHQVYEHSALAAANLEPKDLATDSSPPSSTSGVGVVRKVQPAAVSRGGPSVIDAGESSALPSTASWCVRTCTL